MTRVHLLSRLGLLGFFVLSTQATLGQTTAEISATSGVHPNLAGQMNHPLRYRPDKGDFLIEGGAEFFNGSLYGGNTAFRVDGETNLNSACISPAAAETCGSA